MKLLEEKWAISPRDEDAPPWEEVQDKDWEAMKMAVYAAQVDRMDQGVGRLLAALRALHQEENTLVVFLSDNGGCAEFLLEEPGKPDPSVWGTHTRDGRPMQIGNIPGVRPGPEDTFMTYELPWSNASNAPFRLFKHWVHEGGISTPFIMSRDRTELHDLADKERERVKELAKLYGAWAERCGVLPWPVKASEYSLRMRGKHIHLSHHRGRQFYP